MIKNSTNPSQKRLTTLQVSLLGIILGLRIVLSFVPSINLGNLVQLGVGFIGAALSGALFGPWYALILSLFNDLITSLLQGKNIFLGFTLSAGLLSLIHI